VLTKPAAARKLSSNDPARFVGAAGRSLEQGAPADLSIIDPEFEYNLSTDETGSKSKDSFFIGRQMKGKNQITMMGGRVVWQRDADHLGG
jgi:dihydroorotase